MKTIFTLCAGVLLSLAAPGFSGDEVPRVPDLTQGQSNICPVHRVKMEAKVVPIAYGLMISFFSEEERAEFPFGDEVVPGGCVESNLSPQEAKTYICPRCIEIEKRRVGELMKRIEEAKKAAGR